MTTEAKPKTENSGAFHADLLGGSEALRYRPRRLDAGELSSALSCQFLADGASLGPFSVLDLSPTGLAIDSGTDCVLPPGSSVNELEISYGSDRIWTGTAQSVYQVEGSAPRTGLRFTSGMFDLQLLQLSDSLIETHLALNLDQCTKFEAGLPAAWRADVATVRHLLQGAKEVVEEAESMLSPEAGQRAREERALFERIFEKWGPAYHEELRSLHEQSSEFDSVTRELARAYATRELFSLVEPCPMHRRAYEKPLGYAGDYRMMTLMLQDSYEGDSLYARFLHHVSKHYSFGRMVITRERALRRIIREAISSQERPVRVLSLACGPAVELQNLIREVGSLANRVEFILVDQDEETMQYCHEAVSRELLQRGPEVAAQVTLNCLHLSVRQILVPGSAEERDFIQSNLRDLDLVYSAGLFDYLPQSIAHKLTRSLYRTLRPGGRLWIGNLTESPDTTWMMEHVLAWHLEYRNHETMRNLVLGLSPEPADCGVATDDSELCLFLDAVKPEA